MKRFVLFSLLLTTSLFAQVRDEIVVTASALPEDVDATPAAATIITRDEIDQRAARDVAEVLREVPGLVVSRTGSPGRATSLFTRGSNSTHTLVLWNGIEINNPYFAGYDWGRFSTAAVEQVEVVRGPYSALYGSDAMAGVVNVLTTPKKSGFRGGIEAGGHGLRNGNLAASLVGDATTLSLSYESREDDGFADNDDFGQDSLDALVRWKPRDSLAIGLTARHTSYDLGIPTNLNFAGDVLVPSLNRRQTGTETQLAIPFEHTLGNFSYDLTLAESRRNDDFADPDDPYGLVDIATDSTTRRARLTTRTKTSHFGTIVAGGEWERAEVDDVTNFGANLEGNERTEKSVFIEDRYSRELGSSRLELSAGARFDDYETFGSELSPRIAAAFVTGANKFRVGYGEAFRAPSIGELFFPFSGNADLEAEHSRSIEAGYDRELPKGRFSATLFRGNYDDLIVFDNLTFVFENIGRATAQGLELALEHDVTASVYGSMSYTYTDTDEEGRDRPLLRRPKHSGSLFLGWRGRALDANVVLLHTGARPDVIAVAPFSRISADAHTTVDANVQYRWGRVIPFVKIENLTNETYEEVTGYPSASRRAVVGIRFAM
jgi:vitamin B12 transporter